MILVKRSEQFFYQLYNNYGSSHSHQVLLKLSRWTNSKFFKAFHSFVNNTRPFQLSKILGLFKAGLEFEAGAGTLSCCRAKYLQQQLASCHSGSVTVQSRIQETGKDSLVWMTIATQVRLNWRLRNVLTYLLTYRHHG